MYKLLVLLSALLMLVSCDTGYSGDIDPQKEIFNYIYPLKKGNEWEYVVKESKFNFSNPDALTDLGADTVTYYRIKSICSNDTAWFADKNLHKIDSYHTAKTNNPISIDTTTCIRKTSFYMDNTTDYYLEYGRRDSTIGAYIIIESVSYETPFRILKYGVYPGDTWQQSNLLSKVIGKISGFADLNGERVCLINKTEYIPESPSISPADTTSSDEYYSHRGLVKIVKKKFNSDITTKNGINTTCDIITTTTLIRTNLK